MDPDSTLLVAREIVKRVWHGKPQEGDLETLADAFEAIDQWLSKGGALPHAWERKRT